jgi:hypothetical protein
MPADRLELSDGGDALDLHAAKLDERTRERLHRLVLPDNKILLGDQTMGNLGQARRGVGHSRERST